jgi:RNA polymerase sigma factor (sigma-70 family)
MAAGTSMAVMTAADPSPPTASCPGLDWGACLAANESWLRRVILARAGEPQAVDEIWQQVALAAIEQRWPLADPDRVAPWLHRLAVIASARFRRQLGRGRRAVRALADSRTAFGNGAAPDPLALLMRRERVAITREAMLRLPPRDAEMLLLKYCDRWTYGQIAGHLGITEKAVDSRLFRMRERLRRELATLGIEEDEL